MIKVLALISVCCRTCSSEQLPLRKIHQGKLPIPVTLVHVYICYLFSSIPNNTGPWIKKQGNTIKNNYCLETKKNLPWVLKRTVSSRHLLAPKTNVWTYDNNIRSEGSKEPSQRDDSFEPAPPPTPPPKKNIYI